jgi:hypothetical protein
MPATKNAAPATLNQFPMPLFARKRGRTAMGVGACRVDTRPAQPIANDERDSGDGDQPHGNLSSNCRASIRKSWVLAPRSAKQANLSSAARSAYDRLSGATLKAAARFRANNCIL